MSHWLGLGGRLARPSRKAFGVVSIETTGLFPAYHDRIIEIAVVNVDGDGVTDEWVTLVNPERDIGSTRLHGISARQVVAAPTFEVIAGDLVERLADRVLVGHNGRFQGDFIEYEFGRMGHRVDCTQILCTMTLAQGLGVSGRSLHACCDSLGLRGNGRHDALADARATAGLLMGLFARAHRDGIGVEVPEVSARAALPTLESAGRVVHRGESAAPAVSALAALAERLPVDTLSDESSRKAVLAYVGLLDRTLEDRWLDEGELGALGDVAAHWGLSANAVASIHRRYIAGLRELALADDQLTEVEREDLAVMGALLGADDGQAGTVDAPALAVTDRRSEFVGRTVCFTGSSVCSIDGVPLDRATQEMLAAEAGLVPLDGVTKKLDLLVLADAASNSGKARKARNYGTRLVAERAFWAALGVLVD
ncbi:MAG: exonuclease domain-containing protein [Candidatus Limnocylindrales bacterium]